MLEKSTRGGSSVTLQEIEDLIIELLAADNATTPEALRRELQELGEELPVDSVLAAEVVARVQERCGVVIPATAENSRHLRSVRRFATMVFALVREQKAAATEAAGESA
jgi:acyl carrier protein